jgi:hypothetical protein
MKFFEEFSALGLIIRLVKMTFFTWLNVALINYASSRAMERGDTDWFSALLLLLSLVGSAALLLDAIRWIWKSFEWTSALYLAFCLFNVYYFFRIFICCTPSVGSLV